MPDFPMEGSVRVRIELLGVFAAGAVLGIWHLGMGGRALFVFRSDEPFSSWVWVLSGPLSTLPAVALAIFSRRWSATWLITAGVISLGTLVVGRGGTAHTPGEFWELLLSYGIMVVVPMIGLGLGLFWVQRHLERTDSHQGRPERHRLGLASVVTLGYLLLSLGAFFAADLPILSNAFETSWGFWILPPLLGPLAMLAMMRLLGVPLYLAATVVVFGCLWLATAYAEWRRAALLSALVVWLLSGLFLVAIVQFWG